MANSEFIKRPASEAGQADIVAAINGLGSSGSSAQGQANIVSAINAMKSDIVAAINGLDNITVQSEVSLDNHEVAQAIYALIQSQADYSNFTWDQIQRIVADGAGAAMFPVGMQFEVTHSDYTKVVFDVAHHGLFTDTHGHQRPGMVLVAHDVVTTAQFDAPEAFYYAEEGLAAGDYNVEVPTAYGATLAGYYNFTLTDAVAAGSLLCGFVAAYGSNSDNTNVSVYESGSADTATQTATMTRSDTAVGTTLGVLKDGGDPDNANMNSLQRAAYGNNNWKESAIRQFLNSSAAANSVWSSQHKFDRISTNVNGKVGFLKNLDADFQAAIMDVKRTYLTNNVYENAGFTKSSTYELVDKFFLPTRYEVGLGYERANTPDGSGVVFDLFDGASQADMIKYMNNAAQYWWLGTCYVGYAHNVRLVSPSGTLGSYRADGTYGAVPACVIG